MKGREIEGQGKVRTIMGLHCRRLRDRQPDCKLNGIPALLFSTLILIFLRRDSCALSDDGLALLALKSSIVDYDGFLDDWVESSINPCNWTAIECDELGNVITLQFPVLQNLTGIISGAIGSLQHLSTLSLAFNSFVGSLPPEIVSLTELRILNVSNNNFTSGIPLGMSNLTKLEVIDCYDNNLSGELPVEISALQNLVHIHFGGNNFVGSVPPEYGNFSSKLTYLALGGNYLTGFIPPELGNLTGLTALYMGYWNSFQGGIPHDLGRLTNLVMLDLSNCELTGSIPGTFGDLSKLEYFLLFNNNLSGHLPQELGFLSTLTSLDVSCNQLSGPIPNSFWGLTNVTHFALFKNSFSGELPALLADLPNLQTLRLWDNNFTGEIPQLLGSKCSLIELDISENLLTGELPPTLCSGNMLARLITMNCNLSGPIPDGLGNCTSLQYIRIHDNNFSGPIPEGFFTLPNVSSIRLNNNNLSGSVPPMIDSPMLRVLNLSQNQLSGILPDAMATNLTSLQILYLDGNHLTGSIPGQLCEFESLLEIDLSSNMLTGNIPGDLGKCARMTKLDLSSNHLTGEIPSSMLELLVLAILNLSSNNLSGPIYEDFGLIQSLTEVDFSFNNFSGPIPTKGEAQGYDASSYQGNPFLCGGFPNRPPCISGGSSTNSSSSFARDGSSWSSSDRSLLAWLMGALFSGALMVLLVGMCCFCTKYRRDIVCLFQKTGTERPWKFTPFQRLDFSAIEIVECLNDENIIGRGGAGTVYRGEMQNGEMVAVKKLACGKGTSSYDHGFSAEIRTLGKIRHRFIVRLLGFCTNNEINLLVYDYMPNGSLGEFLHDIKKSGLLDWTTRYNIALQAATGLSYLHHDCSPLIVHRDVKSNNILLDSNLGARVADFGLAKLFQGTDKSESMSSIAGSYGYIAPEYAYTLKVNEKSDTYSFGVVLMELLTGRRPIEPEFGDGVDIVQWVKQKIQTKAGVLEVLDPRIGSATSVPLHEVMLVLRVALLCCSDLPVDRPTMRDVVQMLSDVRPIVRNRSMDSRDLRSQQPLLLDDLLTF